MGVKICSGQFCRFRSLINKSELFFRKISIRCASAFALFPDSASKTEQDKMQVNTVRFFLLPGA